MMASFFEALVGAGTGLTNFAKSATGSPFLEMLTRRLFERGEPGTFDPFDLALRNSVLNDVLLKRGKSGLTRDKTFVTGARGLNPDAATKPVWDALITKPPPPSIVNPKQAGLVRVPGTQRWTTPEDADSLIADKAEEEERRRELLDRKLGRGYDVTERSTRTVLG